MTLTGTIIHVLPTQTGESSRGQWSRRYFILETADDEYPKQVCCTQWGDDIDATSLSPGDRVTAHIDIQSREYKGRWYTDVKAWRVERDGSASRTQAPSPLTEPDDDLPF